MISYTQRFGERRRVLDPRPASNNWLSDVCRPDSHVPDVVHDYHGHCYWLHVSHVPLGRHISVWLMCH